MYYILYTNRIGLPLWELVHGEDAMNVKIDDIVKSQGIDPETITVIHNDDGNLSILE